MVLYTSRNGLHKPESSDIDFPGEMEANTDIIDARIAKCQFSGTRVPNANDDSEDGYAAGSFWFYTGANRLFQCQDAAPGAAIWRQIWPALSTDLSGTITNAQLAGSITNDKLAGSITNAQLAGSISDDKLATSYLKADGSRELSASWDAGSHQIRAETFQSDVATGTAPLTVASSTKVTNLNADLLDGAELSTDTVADPGVDTKIPTEQAVREALTALVADGWIAAGETWTYASADSPTFTFTISGDKTSKYGAGMRIKLTQSSTVKYFIITKVAYSAPNTTVTVYGGTDYDLADSAISSPYYSGAKAPFGFPLDPAKWTVSATLSGAQTSPTINVVYNLGSSNIVVPPGCWRLVIKANLQIAQSSGPEIEGQAGMSTSNNSFSSDETKAMFYAGMSNIINNFSLNVALNLSTKTTYYFVACTTKSSTLVIQISGTGSYAYAVCAYL